MKPEGGLRNSADYSNRCSDSEFRVECNRQCKNKNNMDVVIQGKGWRTVLMKWTGWLGSNGCQSARDGSGRGHVVLVSRHVYPLPLASAVSVETQHIFLSFYCVLVSTCVADKMD